MKMMPFLSFIATVLLGITAFPEPPSTFLFEDAVVPEMQVITCTIFWSELEVRSRAGVDRAVAAAPLSDTATFRLTSSLVTGARHDSTRIGT